MKVFVAGGSGAIGRRLIPRLLEAGHDVVALTRGADKAAWFAELGAAPVVADLLDRDAVVEAVVRAEPEVLIHEATGLDGVTSYRNFDAAFARTNELRITGTDNLLAGARAAGVRRVIAQSFGNWDYERRGGAVKTEDDPLDPDPPATMRRTLAAIRHLESAVVIDEDDLQGVALRYANFYGPGTSFGADGTVIAAVRDRKLPLIGDGAGVWSFIHLDDAAEATVAAVERGAPGVYNVADDEPATVAEWLPALAEILGAKPPRRVPAWVGRLGAGASGLSMFTQIRGASAEKAKRELDWTPRFASWRDGFRAVLA